MAGDTDHCPACSAVLVGEANFRRWCPACNWNAASDDVQDQSRFSRLMDRIGERHGRKLLERMLDTQPISGRPATSPGMIMAAILCCTVLSIGVALVCLGLWLVWSFWPNAIAVIGGLALIGLALLQVPRPRKMPETTLDRAEHQSLFELVDRIADNLAIKPVEHISADEEFNASMAETGWRGEPLLTIGLPMWKLLEPQQRVALIGHELAHRANRDPLRSRLFAISLLSLEQWLSVLKQEAHAVAEAWTAFAANIVMWPLARVVELIQYAIRLLLYISHQKSEYYADYLAARVAGTDAATALLFEMAVAEHLNTVLVQSAGAVDADGTTFIEKFRRFALALPVTEKQRLKCAMLARKAHIDDSHPPTEYRLRYLLAKPIAQPAVVLTQEQSLRIDEEFRKLERRMSERLVAQFCGES